MTSPRRCRPSVSLTRTSLRGGLVLYGILLAASSSHSPACCALAFLGETDAPQRRQHQHQHRRPPPLSMPLPSLLLVRDAPAPPMASPSPAWLCRRPISMATTGGNSRPHDNNNEPPTPAPPRSTEFRGLVEMARLKNAPMSAALVAIGAYGARQAALTSAQAASEAAALAVNGCNPSGLGAAVRLTLGTILTILVTTSSMLINDYYDHREGVDTAQTKPGRPLITGAVRPATVKRVLKFGYALHLILLCCVDSMVLRLYILANTLLTYLYSVHLKPRTGVKNLACAAIVSMAVGVGAIARCGNGKGDALVALRRVWRPMVTVGGLIWHREVVMDIKDLEGDALAGIRTVPVAYGKRTAMLLSFVPLAGAVAACASVPCSPFGPRAVLASAPLIAQGLVGLWCITREFDKGSLKVAIEGAPLWLAVSLIALVTGG